MSKWIGIELCGDETMEALVLAGNGTIELLRVPVPTAAFGRVLIKVDFVGICGTDLHLLEGTSHYVQSGLTSYPIRFGHEYAGTVVAVGEGVDVALIGQAVTGDAIVSCGHCPVCKSGRYNVCPDREEVGVKGDFPGAAAEYFSVPSSNVKVVPEGVSARHALLAEPAVTVLNGLEASGLQPGETVAVLGTGTLGMIAIQIAARMGCSVTAIGIEEAGLAEALKHGAVHAYRPELAPSNQFDVVLELSGARSVGSLITRIAAPGGRIVQVGLASGPVDGVSLNSFISKALQLTGVLGGVHLVARALTLIANGVIRPDELIDRVIPADQAIDAFSAMKMPGRARPKVVLDMSRLSHATSSTAPGQHYPLNFLVEGIR